MFEYTEIPRTTVHDTQEVRRLVRAQRPFIVEEASNPAFQRFAQRWTANEIGALFGDRDWRVQDFRMQRFDPFEPPVARTSLMPFSRFMEKFEHPDEDVQNYVNIAPSDGMDYAMPLFEEMRALGRSLPLTQIDGQDLKTVWLGGPGTVTPLHFDTYARSHGTVSGEKVFVMFPPDLHHLRKLETYSIRSTQGWWSRIGYGPLDPERFPQLQGTQPWRAVCRPGDFLWLPPCWWHHVSIETEPTVTISATHYDRHTYRYLYHWRIRLTRWLGRRNRLRKLLADRSAKGAATASST